MLAAARFEIADDVRLSAARVPSGVDKQIGRYPIRISCSHRLARPVTFVRNVRREQAPFRGTRTLDGLPRVVLRWSPERPSTAVGQPYGLGRLGGGEGPAWSHGFSDTSSPPLALGKVLLQRTIILRSGQYGVNRSANTANKANTANGAFALPAPFMRNSSPMDAEQQGREQRMSRQRLECVELAPALARLGQPQSASKLDAPQKLGLIRTQSRGREAFGVRWQATAPYTDSRPPAASPNLQPQHTSSLLSRRLKVETPVFTHLLRASRLRLQLRSRGNPVRGGLFIARAQPPPSFFLFFSGAGTASLLCCPPVAPLKNKKKGGVVGGAAAINRPPLTGF